VFQEGERRYAPFDVSDSMIGNRKYFDDLVEWAENNDNVAALFEYLMGVDLSKFSLKDEIPQTTALTETRILSLPGITTWFIYRVIDDCPKAWSKHSIKNADFFADFLAFSRANKDDYTISKFGKQIHLNLEACPGLIKHRSNAGQVWTIDREKCFKWFVEKKYTTETELPPVVEMTFSTDY
jgi:hypothetical protein